MLTHECKGNASYKHLSIKQENIDLYYKNKPRIFATVPLIPCIDKEIGQPTSCVLKISSFTDGYLKEHTYVADFTEDNNRWKTIDGDEDGNTWSHDESAITTNGKDEWLISPEVKLDPTKSYYVLCEFETDLNQSVNIKFTRGNGQTINDQIEIIDEFNDIIMNDYTQMEVGTTFHPESESNFFGIHIENMNGTNVRIKNLKIMAQLQISVAYFCSIGLYFLV